MQSTLQQSTAVDRETNRSASSIRQGFEAWPTEPMVPRQNRNICWISIKRLSSIMLMSPPAGSSRARRSGRSLESSRTVKASTSSALMEVNLAVPKLQGGVLRSATMSPQTSQRVQGPTSSLSSTEISPTCLSGSLGRSKYL